MAMLAAVVRHSARVAAATRVTTTPAVGCVARATCQRVCASQTVGKTQQQHHALQPSSPFVLTPSHVCLCCCPVWLQCAAAKHKRRSGYNSTASYWWRQGMQLWLHVLGFFWATRTATLTLLLGPCCMVHPRPQTINYKPHCTHQTHSGAKKRFRITGSGRIKHSKLGRGHKRSHKGRDRINRLGNKKQPLHCNDC